jgi:hypothetical protein
MSDGFRKVRPGEPVRVAAQAWNKIIDQVVTKPRFDGNTSAPPQTNFRVRVRNNTSTGISRWGVLHVQGLLEAPTGVGSQFEQWPGVVGYQPGADPDQTYVVAVEPIPAGAIGQAAIAGVVQSRILVNCAGHKHAKPVSSEMDYMETAYAGPFRILWAEPTGPANPTGVTGPTKPWALLAFTDYDRPHWDIEGHTTGAVQLLGHREPLTGSTGCDIDLQWYTVTECSGNPSYATSYFL